MLTNSDVKPFMKTFQVVFFSLNQEFSTAPRILPEHGAERTQWGEAVGRHLAQLDVAHGRSPGTAAHRRWRDQMGSFYLHWLQLSPTPQQL